MRIISPDTPLPLITGHLDESPASLAAQRALIYRLLARWARLGLNLDAVSLPVTSEVDYLIVSAGYVSGPLPNPILAVECKRRWSPLRYDSVFLETRKRNALLALCSISGVPLFATEWDDVIVLHDVRRSIHLPEAVMARLDRGRANDTDRGIYVPVSACRLIGK